MSESTAPFGAPQFDKIRTEHYLPAFETAIAEAKAEIDAVVSNPDEATFENTIEAMEYSGKTLNRVAGIFYNLMEAHTNDQMQEIAEKIYERHTVLTELLIRLGVPEEIAAADACRMEHAISDESFDAIKRHVEYYG